MSFKTSDYKDGKKLCTICNEYQIVPNFYWNKNKDRPYSYCIPCQKRRTINKQRQCKREAVDYKGGKCILCGYNKCLSALEFHHRDPNSKDFSFGASKYRNYQKLPKEAKLELDKCDLLCANCHRETHSKIIG